MIDFKDSKESKAATLISTILETEDQNYSIKMILNELENSESHKEIFLKYFKLDGIPIENLNNEEISIPIGRLFNRISYNGKSLKDQKKFSEYEKIIEAVELLEKYFRCVWDNSTNGGKLIIYTDIIENNEGQLVIG